MNPSAPVQIIAPQQGSQPNFLERMLPTAGGILGGIAGEGLDVFGGGIVGAAGGSALGKTLENRLTGQGLGTGVGTSAIEGGAGQAGGQLLGGVLKGAGGLLAKYGANDAAKVASDEAATTAAKTASDNSQAIIDHAAATKNNYGVLNPKLQTQLKLGTNQKFVDSMGFDSTNPYHMQNVSNAGLELNKVVDNALQSAGNINTKGMGNDLFESMKQAGSTDFRQTPLGKAAVAAGVDPGETGRDLIPEQMPATQLRRMQQYIGTEIGNTQKIINNAENTGMYNKDAEAQLSSLQGIYKNLGSKLSGNPDIDSAIKNAQFTPEDQDALSQQYGPKLAKFLSDKVSGAQSYDDIVSEMKKFAQMDTASRLSIDDIEDATGSDRSLARAKVAGQEGIPQPANNPTPKPSDHLTEAVAHALTGNRTGAVRSLLSAVGTAKGPAAEKTSSILNRIAKFVPPAAQVVANSPNDIPQQGGGMNPSMTAGTPMQPGAQPPQGSFTTGMPAASPVDQLYQQLLSTLQNGQANPLLPTSPTAISASTTGLGALAPYLQKAAVANTALQSLMQEYQQAGGGQGLGGGVLNTLGQTLSGGPGSLLGGGYNSQAEQLNHQLQGLGVSVPLPSLMLSGQGANAGFSTLQNILQTMGGGGTLGTVPTGAV